MKKFALYSLLPVFLLFIVPPENSSGTQNPDGDEVVIGTRIAPPFVIEQEDGTLTGLTITLWEHIADEMGLNYRYEITDIEGMLSGVESGEFYAAASALTITAQREATIDFTHPFYVSGLGIATHYTPRGVWQAFWVMFSPEFLYAVGLLAAVLLFWGFLVWVFERKANQEEFGGSTAEGIGSGFWWAAVTMTTVGYGDKSPRSIGGRIVGFIWMFSAIIIISFFTGTIASSLTVTQLDSVVDGPEDLPFVRTGVLANSATETFFDDKGIRYRSYETIAEGLQAVADERLDAFVHDHPILKYETSLEFRNEVRVLPRTFSDQYYGIALPMNAEYRNRMNTIILEFINAPEWEEIQGRYGID